jgi:TRAP-type C4-dicarboxylate transport system substrate-binding protein
VALQWGNHAKCMSAVNLSQATGATLIAKKAWDQLTPADQKVLLEEAEALQADVLKQVRADNAKSLDAMKQKGLQVVQMSPELLKEFEKAAEEVARSNAGTVSKEFQQKVEKLVADYRAKHK